MDYVEANSDLNDEEFEEWKKYKRDSLKKQSRENVEEWNRRDKSAIDNLIKAGKDELKETITVSDEEIDVQLSLDNDQINLISEIQKYDKDIKSEDIDIDEVEDLTEKMISLLSSICIETNKEDWKKFREENGLYGLNIIGGRILSKTMTKYKDKVGQVEKFRK